MSVVKFPVIAHLQPRMEAPFKPQIKVDEVGIDVVEKRPFRHQPQGHGQAAGERLHQPPVAVGSIHLFQIGDQPPLPSRPFEGRVQPLGHRVGEKGDDHIGR